MLRRFVCPCYALSKARFDGSRVISQAQHEAEQRRITVAAAAPAWLKRRVEGEKALPMVERTQLQGVDERVQATAAYVVGVGGKDEKEEEWGACCLPTSYLWSCWDTWCG